MNKILLAGVVILVLAGGYFFFSGSQRGVPTPSPAPTAESPKAVDWRAGFAIITRGTKRDFSASKYHNLSADVFIEAGKPQIVQVKKAGVTWAGFFATLPMKLTPECLTTGTGQTFCTGAAGTLKFYLNGERAENFLDREVRDGDRALISFGSETEAEIQDQVSQVPSP